MRYRHVALLLAAWLGTTGFGLPNGYEVGKLKPELKPDYGRVLISAGAPRVCWGPAMQLIVRQLPERFMGGMMVLAVDDPIVASDFEDHKGSFSGSALPAGTYEVYAEFTGNAQTRNAPRYVFTLAPGESLYLGEYWLENNCALTTSGGFRDQGRRDLARLKSDNPALAGAAFVTRLPTEFGRWPQDRKLLPDPAAPH